MYNGFILAFKTEFVQVCGVDDAGRGSMLGPLVIAGVSMNKKNLRKLSLLESETQNGSLHGCVNNSTKKLSKLLTAITLQEFRQGQLMPVLKNTA